MNGLCWNLIYTTQIPIRIVKKIENGIESKVELGSHAGASALPTP
jgi:hypothetical protein